MGAIRHFNFPSRRKTEGKWARLTSRDCKMRETERPNGATFQRLHLLSPKNRRGSILTSQLNRRSRQETISTFQLPKAGKPPQEHCNFSTFEVREAAKQRPPEIPESHLCGGRVKRFGQVHTQARDPSSRPKPPDSSSGLKPGEPKFRRELRPEAQDHVPGIIASFCRSEASPQRSPFPREPGRRDRQLTPLATRF